ncbi:hypothetical protein U1Q18_000771 [Sarracenia purpurea var. burkii]
MKAFRICVIRQLASTWPAAAVESPSETPPSTSNGNCDGDIDLVLLRRDLSRHLTSRPLGNISASSVTASQSASVSSGSSSGASTCGRWRCVESFIGRIWPLRNSSSAELIDPVDAKPHHDQLRGGGGLSGDGMATLAFHRLS